jgi:hypothetical protein
MLFANAGAVLHLSVFRAAIVCCVWYRHRSLGDSLFHFSHFHFIQFAVSYHSAHLDVIRNNFPEDVGRIIRDVWRLLLAGKIDFLRTKVFTLDQASEALQHLSTGKHIGKVVVLNRKAATLASSRALATGTQLRVIASKRSLNAYNAARVHEVVEELATVVNCTAVGLEEFEGDIHSCDPSFSLLLVGSRAETCEMVRAVPRAAGMIRVLILPCEEETLTGLDVLSEAQVRGFSATAVELCDPWEVQNATQVAATLHAAAPSQLHVLGTRIPYARAVVPQSEQTELGSFFAGFNSPSTTSGASGFESRESLQAFLLSFMKADKADKSLDEHGFDSLSALNLRGTFLRAGFPKHLLPGAFFEEERIKSMPIGELAGHLSVLVRSSNGATGEDGGVVVSAAAGEPATTKARKRVLCLHGASPIAVLVRRWWCVAAVCGLCWWRRQRWWSRGRVAVSLVIFLFVLTESSIC